jgi:trehalose synthase
VDRGLRSIAPPPIDLGAYAAFASPATLRRIADAAHALADARVLHVCTGPPDSATAHLLEWLVPLMQAVGVETEWRVVSLQGRDDVAPMLRHVLGIAAGALPQPLWEDLLELNRRVVAGIDDDWDVIVAHDVELALLASVAPESPARWLLRPGALTPALDAGGAGEFRFHLGRFSAVIVDVNGPASVSGRPARHIPVGVDPLAPTSRALGKEVACSLCESLGLDPERPIIVHSACHSGLAGVSDAIDAYWALKASMSTVQLAVLAPVAISGADTARASSLAARTIEDPDLHVLSALSEPEVNAVRAQASLVVQTSHVVGSDLDVLEGWWKARPVVRTLPRRGGIVDGPAVRARTRQELRSFMRVMLADAERAARLGRFGRARVRQRLLVPSALTSWLEVLGARAPTRR